MIRLAGTVLSLFVSAFGPWGVWLGCFNFGSLEQTTSASSSQTGAQKESEQNETERASKYSAVPAKGEFQDYQFVELAPDQDRRVVRECRHSNTFPEITDQPIQVLQDRGKTTSWRLMNTLSH
jgi:hypothetical protein